MTIFQFFFFFIVAFCLVVTYKQDRNLWGLHICILYSTHLAHYIDIISFKFINCFCRLLMNSKIPKWKFSFFVSFFLFFSFLFEISFFPSSSLTWKCINVLIIAFHFITNECKAQSRHFFFVSVIMVSIWVSVKDMLLLFNSIHRRNAKERKRK